MKHLIIGAAGQVGKALSATLKDETVINTFHNNLPEDYIDPIVQLDVTNHDDVKKIISTYKPEVIWLPAAKTNVDQCDHQTSHTTNVIGPRNIIQTCNELHSKRKPIIVFFSTDYIFDGQHGLYYEDDIPNPINEYGLQKLKAEHLLSTLYSHFVIIRTCWVYGLTSQNNFVMRTINDLKAGKEISVSSDRSCPTYAPDLASASVAYVKHCLANKQTRQVINIAGTGLVRKDFWARDIANAFGYNQDLILTATTNNSNIVSRPTNGGLLSHKLYNAIGRDLRHYSICLEEMNAQLSSM